MLNSPVDIALVFGVALLIFGPKKLPELGKSLGQSIGNFKRSLQEAQDDVKTGPRSDHGKTEENSPGSGAPSFPAGTASSAPANSDDATR